LKINREKRETSEKKDFLAYFCRLCFALSLCRRQKPDENKRKDAKTKDFSCRSLVSRLILFYPLIHINNRFAAVATTQTKVCALNSFSQRLHSFQNPLAYPRNVPAEREQTRADDGVSRYRGEKQQKVRPVFQIGQQRKRHQKQQFHNRRRDESLLNPFLALFYPRQGSGANPVHIVCHNYLRFGTLVAVKFVVNHRANDDGLNNGENYQHPFESVGPAFVCFFAIHNF
jgi:hypothetical protein